MLDCPDGWEPRPNIALDRALPAPWDPEYTVDHGQPFQPVKLWRNAVMLSRYIARSPATVRADKARLIVAKLVDRMRDYTVADGDVSFIENRFAFDKHGYDLPAPWVSSICNAFAILACDRMMTCLDDVDLLPDMRAYAAAFHRIHSARSSAWDRWISYVDERGYLWFDEYPKPDGTPTLVLNGHIYSVLALRVAHDHLPDAGHDHLVRAGAATVETYLPWFRIPHRPNRYSLHGPAEAEDYLPQRTIRQLFQLEALTGETRFGRFAKWMAQDATDHVGAPEIAQVLDWGKIVQDRRADAALLPASRHAGYRLRKRAYLPKPPALSFARWLRWRQLLNRYN